MSRFDLFFILIDECNEVIDYAIARKIVDLHSNIEESVEKVRGAKVSFCSSFLCSGNFSVRFTANRKCCSILVSPRNSSR